MFFLEIESDSVCLRLVFTTFADLSDALDYYLPRYPDTDSAYGSIIASNPTDAMDMLMVGQWESRTIVRPCPMQIL